MSRVARGLTRSSAAGGPRSTVVRASPIPDDRIRDVFDAARRDLVLLPAGEDVSAGPARRCRGPRPRSCSKRWTSSDSTSRSKRSCAGYPTSSAWTAPSFRPTVGLGANGAMLRSVGLHWQLTRDGSLIERLVGPIAKAGHWIDKRRTARRRPLLAEATYLDTFWSVAGLWAVTPAPRGHGPTRGGRGPGRFWHPFSRPTSMRRGAPMRPPRVRRASGTTRGSVRR